MRVLFDATSMALSGYHKGGAYRYGLELLRHLPPELASDDELALYFNFIRAGHRARMDEVVKDSGVSDSRWCRIPPQILKKFGIAAERTGGKHDVFHGPFDVVPHTKRAARVVTIHDLAFLRAPEGLPADWIAERSAVVPPSARRAHRIITVSAFTKNDVVEHFGVPPERVQPIHHGVPPECVPPADTEADLARLHERYGINPGYILYLGTLQPNKNIEGLCAAYQQLRTNGFEGQLVLAGSKGWLYDEMWQRIVERGHDAGVLQTGFVDDEDIPRLYGNCAVFALLSFLEGFGIPVIEAMACGAPVVIADACSLPEVAGDAAVKVDPHDSESMAAGLQQALGSERAQWVARSLERASGFTWQRCAREHAEAYRLAFQEAS